MLNLIDVKNSLMMRNQLFFKECEIVFVEILNKKFTKFTKQKGDIDGYADIFTYDYSEVQKEFETNVSVFIIYRNDSIECNIENY